MPKPSASDWCIASTTTTSCWPQPTRWQPAPASAPRELLIEVKRTIQEMADVVTHPEAVDRELVPQVWSTRQPWFAERIAALQAKISSKKG